MKTKSPFLKASQMQKKSLMTAFVLKFMLSFFVLTVFIGKITLGQIYTENFASGTLPTGWVIINAGSGNNWTIFNSNPYNDSYCMSYQWNNTNAANTWAFTQGINMTAGKTYRVEFYQRVGGSSYTEKMKVTVGTAQTVASQTTTLLDLPSLTNETYTNQISSEYTCPATGTYYFAFNCYSTADQYYLYVDNIRIYETSGTGTYCTPNHNNQVDQITNVTLETLAHANAQTTGYVNATTGLTVPDLYAGGTHSLNIKANGNGVHYADVWIDFNDNASFSDAGEKVGTITTGATGPFDINVSLTIPSGATLGNHRMRILWQYTNNYTNDPCCSGAWGQTIDYTVNIKAVTGPTLTLSNPTTPVLASTVPANSLKVPIHAFIINGSGGGGTLTAFKFNTAATSTYTTSEISNFKLWVNTSNDLSTATQLSSIATVSGPGVAQTFTGLSYAIANVTRYFWITMDVAATVTDGHTINVIASTSADMTTTATKAGSANASGVKTFGYCTPTYSSLCSSDDYINNFSTTGGTTNITNNNTGCNGQANNYIYYSGMTVSQHAGSSFNISVQSGPNSYQGFRIWVDWNKNGDFGDAGEDVWNSGGGSTSPYTGTITIPAGTPVGTYRMRVRSLYAGAPSASDYCSYLNYGETEDYNLSVLASGPMTYSSSTVTQASTADISNCSTTEPIICLQVVTNGNLNPISLTQINLQNSGTAPLAGIDKIHVYYTGTSSSFQAINPFDGIGTTPATGTITISGNQQLVMGTNYFWIAYDMNTTATVGTNVDAKIITPNGIIVNGTGRTPTTVDPSGNRTITTCVPSPGGVSNGLSVWYKADNSSSITLSAGKVSEWASSGGSVASYSLTQATAANQPSLVSLVDYKYFNYNRKIRFNGSTTYLESTTWLDEANNLIGSGTGSFYVVLSKDALDGSALCYRNVSGYRFQFKPKFRIQSGDLLTGSTIDVYNPINSSYHTYFPNGEWADDAAFITFSQGINTALNIAINSKICNTLSNSSNPSFAPSITAGLSIGRNGSYGGGEYVSSDIGEIIFYSINPSDYDKKRIDTYLSIKYGVTRGNNSGTSTDYNYVASNGTTVFDKSANTGYNNDIAGIARDDASGLNQKQSLSVNTSDILTIGLGTISGENLTNTNTFPKDRSFVVWGNNGLPTVSSTATQIPAAASKLPPGIESRIQRVWKYQNTNFIGSASGATPIVKVGFEMFGLVNYTSVGNLRLLMDDDGVDWSNAWVSNPLSQAAVQTLSRIEFPNVILEAARPYITLASINKTSTPLPVEITEFNVNCDENKTILTWTTASETNNKYFTLERSFDLKNWESIATIDGAGNSNSVKHYFYTDNKPSAEMLYYRLKQTDFDGQTEVFIPISANCKDEFTAFTCYPNPFTDQLNVVAKNIYSDEVDVTIRNIMGQIVTQQRINKDEISQNNFTLDLGSLSQGTYSIEFKAGNYIDTQKILKN